jgi:hypothetical protein
MAEHEEHSHKLKLETKFSHEGSKTQRNMKKFIFKVDFFHQFLRVFVTLWHVWFRLVRVRKVRGPFFEENGQIKKALPPD